MSIQHPNPGVQPEVRITQNTVKQIENGFSITTDLPPCCLEFCPDAPGFFVVGCYKLVEGDPDSKSEDKVEEAMQAMRLEDQDFLTEERQQDGGNGISPPSESKDAAKISTKNLSEEREHGGENGISPSESEEALDPATVSRKDFAEQPKPMPPKRVQKRVGCLYLYRLYVLDGQTKSCVSPFSAPFSLTCFKKHESMALGQHLVTKFA